MNHSLTAILTLTLCLACNVAKAQVYNQLDDTGQLTQRDESTNQNFNKHNTDTTKNKEIPKGLKVWRIDRRFGDITPAVPDSAMHLFPNTLTSQGLYGQYNTIGNNYAARESRIVIDRPLTSQFLFTQPYSQVMKQPDQFLFTNTLSPLTNITYDNCGDKTNGEDHIDALFAVNASKKLGFGFDLNYAYARGYYANQSTSHFGATFFGSYIGDRYNMHAMFSTYHQKAAENGGITDDNYITHPESFDDSYAEDEIPTVLEQNWNRNDNIHLFLTHRYSFGFYRKVKMTDEELKAKQFADASKKDNEERKKKQEANTSLTAGRKTNDRTDDKPQPSGRPEGARIAGDEPAQGEKAQADTTRIKVSEANQDSILAAKAQQDSIDATMKREYVPVTSFIHTLDLNRYTRIYQAYASPTDYYLRKFYETVDYTDNAYSGDSIFDQTKLLSVKNTFAIALLEGFNKYAKAGLKVFATHEYRHFNMPELVSDTTDVATMGTWNEHNISIGGQLIKQEGQTWHYNATAEAWLAGEDAGQLKIDFNTDLNFRLFGDTVTLAAKAYFYRLNPTFYQRNYHSKHLWWDDDGLSKETRTHLEGLFSYRKTNTRLRVAIDEIQNYTYFATSYATTTSGRTDLTARVIQSGSDIALLTAQLMQNFRLGPLYWENVVTYQKCSEEDVLPVPTWNIFTNLYLKFKVAKVLSIELGADAYYFSKYCAPHFVPQLNQFAVQRNDESKVELGGYPFVDLYANMHLKHTRFFLVYSHATAGSGNSMYFLTPHYPTNGTVLRFGLSWDFFN